MSPRNYRSHDPEPLSGIGLGDLSAPMRPLPLQHSRDESSMYEHSSAEEDDGADFDAPFDGSRRDLVDHGRKLEVSQTGYQSLENRFPTKPSNPILREAQPSKSNTFNELWGLEIICLLLALACILAIVIVLQKQDGKRLSQWTFYFSLNTVVAFLGSTIARTALVFAVSSAIAQGKWIWFHKRQSQLDTFEAIENASRSVFGGLQLLFLLRRWHILSLGALLTILSLAIDPVFQGLINTPGRLVPADGDDLANIAMARIVDGGSLNFIQLEPVELDGNVYANVTTSPDFSVTAAIYGGLQAALLNKSPDATSTCSTGNCTWPIFVSLAVCNYCFDVSSHLIKTSVNNGSFEGDVSFIPPSLQDNSALATGDGSTYSLPAGNRINNYQTTSLGFEFTQGPVFMTALLTTDPAQTISFRNSQTLLGSISILRADSSYIANQTVWGTTPVTATECGLQLCLNAYRTNVTMGKLTEDIVHTSSVKTPASWLVNNTAPLPDTTGMPYANLSALGTLASNPIYQGGYAPRSDFQLDASAMNASWIPAGTVFNVTQSYLLSTLDFLETLFPKIVTAIPNTTTVEIPQLVLFGDEGLLYTTPILQPLYQSTNLTATMDFLARSLTNAIRDKGVAPMIGTAQQYVVFYEIRWPLLIIPILFFLGSICFCLLSILQTRRAGLRAWKSNSLATMIHGIDSATRARLRYLRASEDLSSAGRIVVAMRRDVDGIELKDASLSRSTYGS